VTLSSSAFVGRQIKNKLAQWLITLGGVSVLFTLVLIFLYLLYVIKPIFESADIETEVSFPLSKSNKTLSVGIDEYNEVSYTLDDSGQLNFYQTKTVGDRNLGDLIWSRDLLEDDLKVEQFVKGSTEQSVILDDENNVYVYEVKYSAQYNDDSRVVQPSLSFPLGEENIEILETGNANELAFAMNEERAVFITYTEDGNLVKANLIAEDDFNYDPEFEAEFESLEIPFSSVDNIQVSPDLSRAFVRHGNYVQVYDIEEDTFELLYEFTANEEPNTEITSMALLSGASSLLFGDSKGRISQWFEITTSEGRVYQHIRSFETTNDDAIVKIVPEKFRKTFFTVSASGSVGVFHSTSEATLWQGQLSDSQIAALSIAPRANALLFVNQDSLTLAKVTNEHPEVTWSALWQEVWYEGYAEPEYVWQSTSGSDDFEAKFSLVPISFGTIKAASYAMLFAVPIALSAAIYTAYFMTPGLRRKVKPTIELMEALPTVILGFLAGLWLAPIIENYLPAIMLMAIFLPIFTLLAAFIWFKLPRELKNKIPETVAPIVLLPVLVLATLFAFQLSPLMEQYFFGGDVRQFITNDLGISFDQRNALVVGIAMGFAVIPTIFSMAEDAIFSVPKHLTSGSLALGATQWQTLIKVVLLTASPGIFSAVMMGLGRAVGETMIVLMATGNTPILDWSIFQGMRTLAANIAVEMPESEVGSSHYRILFLAAFVLFVFTFVFNTLAEFIRQRLRDKYSSL